MHYTTVNLSPNIYKSEICTHSAEGGIHGNVDSMQPLQHRTGYLDSEAGDGNFLMDCVQILSKRNLKIERYC